MFDHIHEWLGLLTRWIHLIAGISWIGNSFYFMWMDSNFTPLEKPDKGTDGELHMVHGGHFYRVEKQKFQVGKIPALLHWFKWEATFTWISGFVLLILLYYFSNAVYLIDPQVRDLTPTQGIIASLVAISGSWLVYDRFWVSKFAENNFKFALGLSIAFVIFLSYVLCHTFSGRGAFLHLGSIFATCMVLNVWIRILPGQQKMLEQAKAGIEPDYSAGIKAKWRSTHNSYITLPVLFTMISNHFPMLYSNPNKWILLIFVCIAGGAFRHAMLQWNIEKSGVKSLAFSGLNIFVVFFMTIPKSNLSDSKVVTFNQIKPIIQNRCSSCHSSNPTDDIFKVAPLGLMLDQDSQIQAFAAKIYERTVTLKNMPFNNKTQMTDQERSMIESWYKSTE